MVFKMKPLELIYKHGPHGDEMTYYDIRFNERMTVADMIQYALSQEDRWGEIKIGSSLTLAEAEYKYGILIRDNIQEAWKSRVITRAIAYGGWGRMTYVVQEMD